MSDDNTFRVWIGCLACYNNGRLTGQWYDASEAGEVTTKALHAADNIVTDDKGYVQGAEVYGPHEELWVMDLANAPRGYHREMSPMEAQRIAEILEAIDEDNRDAFAAYCSITGAEFSEDNVSDFEDHFHGRHESFRDYADEYADELLSAAKSQLGIDDDHPLIRHFDFEAYARELESDYYTEDAPDGGVFIFSN